MKQKIEALKKQRAKARKIKDTLDHYHELFAADGRIDAVEQGHLDRMIGMIAQIDKTIDEQEDKLGFGDKIANKFHAAKEGIGDFLSKKDDIVDKSLVEDFVEQDDTEDDDVRIVTQAHDHDDHDHDHSHGEGHDDHNHDDHDHHNHDDDVVEEDISGDLSGSVGKGGANKKADVLKIQELLNIAGYTPALAEDGAYGKKTETAIIAYQQQVVGQKGDGVVSVGGATWKSLNAGYLFPTADDTIVEEDVEPLEIKQEHFNQGFYFKKNYVPSVGSGLFDVTLKPATAVLEIKMRINFDFKDGTAAKFEGVEDESAIWTDKEKKEWTTKYIAMVEKAWDGQHNFTHPDLKDYEVTVDVDIEESASSWHYDLNITKIPKGTFKGSSVSHYVGGDGDALAKRNKHFSTLDSEDLTEINKGGAEKQSGAVHEAGHMFGLGDEYADDRDGITHAALVKDALGTVIEEGNHTGVMSTGKHIEKQHYITFLDALKAVTKLDKWEFKK